MSVLYLSFLSAQRKAGRVAAEGTTMLRATRIISATHNLEDFGIGIFRYIPVSSRGCAITTAKVA